MFQNKGVTISELRSENEQNETSRWRMFFKIHVLKNLARFTAKHLLWSLFLITLQALRHVTLLKIDSITGIFL